MTQPSEREAQTSARTSQSLGSLLRQTGLLYRQEGLAFTRVLGPSVAQLVLGLYGALALSLWFETWMAAPGQVELAQAQPGLVIAGVFALCGGGLYFFFRGSWQYLIHWVSLCRNAQQALDGEPIDFKGAYAQWVAPAGGVNKARLVEWVVLWCGLPALPLAPLVGLPLCGALIPNAPPELSMMLVGVGMLLGLVFFVGWMVVQFLLSYGFQVLAFEGAEQKLLPLMWRSGRLTCQRPWLTLALQAILLLGTNYVFTAPVIGLLRFARLLAPLDRLNGWLVGVVMNNASQTFQDSGAAQQIAPLLKSLNMDMITMTQSVTDSMVGLTLTLLLLPLGTLAFTLAYLDQVRQEALPNN